MSDLAKQVLDGIAAKRLAAAQRDAKIQAEIVKFKADFAPLLEALELLIAAGLKNGKGTLSMQFATRLDADFKTLVAFDGLRINFGAPDRAHGVVTHQGGINPATSTHYTVRAAYPSNLHEIPGATSAYDSTYSVPLDQREAIIATMIDWLTQHATG